MLAKDWLEFEESCRQCHNCRLAQTRQNVVIYRGSIPAPLLLIGEGPGADEDKQGKPFVGRSGKTLDYLLKAHGLTEDNYHIANIVKCRPPENRKPKPDEVISCKQLLEKQISFVQPKLVLLLGATAYNHYTNDKTPISKIRGEFLEYGDQLLMPTFHPAYILRNANMKPLLWEDIAKVRAKLESLKLVPTLKY